LISEASFPCGEDAGEVGRDVLGGEVRVEVVGRPDRLVPQCSGEGLEAAAVPEPAGGEGVAADVRAAVGNAGALAAGAPPAREGGFADRALAVEGLSETLCKWCGLIAVG
jgi:hypothetical protein